MYHAHIVGRIERAVRLIDTEYSRSLKLAALAAASGISTFHFARVFRAVVGMPPHQYLISVRLREAVHRLECGESVTSACYAVGFSSPSHFTRTFRREFGFVPSTLIKRDIGLTD